MTAHPPPDRDIGPALAEAVRNARSTGTPVCIEGGDTKAFLGRHTEGESLAVAEHQGVVSYEPSELVLTARAGTPVTTISQSLAARGQMLPFEPPCFGAAATLGGTLACALSGPRRPYAGAARDFVLGVKIINGKGEILSFGGQVMKNVAGYDLSRLMTGAMGTLGVLLEASLKVLPVPGVERSVRFRMPAGQALTTLASWGGQPLPLSAASHADGVLNVRLSGTPSGVAAALERLAREAGGEEFAGDDYWAQLREQRLTFFGGGEPLWRLSVPPAPMLDLPGRWLLDWAGAQRWLRPAATAACEEIRSAAARAGGHATLFRNGDRSRDIFTPLTPGLLALHQRLKTAFDPDALFNRGRMYPEL